MKDIVIIGGGPGGLAAALALGRARKQVLLCDAGPRRNARAAHLHNFVTRDGTPPEEFRRIGREQLATYPNVAIADAGVAAIDGERNTFRVALSTGEVVAARRILLCTGMVDEMLPIEGFAEAWGHSIFQCPYCHGWEVQDRAWGFLLTAGSLAHAVPFAIQATGWTRDLTVFTNGLALDDERPFAAAGIRVERAPVVTIDEGIIELANGNRIPYDALFAHPPQQQVPLVRALGVALDADNLVVVDPMRRETSIPGVFAGGDCTTRMQGAIMAAAASVQAATILNVDLAMDRDAPR